MVEDSEQFMSKIMGGRNLRVIPLPPHILDLYPHPEETSYLGDGAKDLS
jgi:hypothetical protein